jgi:hypothetical protein
VEGPEALSQDRALDTSVAGPAGSNPAVYLRATADAAREVVGSA